MRILKAALLSAGASMIAALVACGGSSHSTTPPPPPPTITVALSSTPSTLYVNDVISITATVTGDSTNAGVNWSCAPSGSCGAFKNNSSASGTAVQYTAPSKVPSGTVTLTATSAASSSSSKSSSAITIQSFTLSAGNYVFSVTGTDTIASGLKGNPDSPYVMVGAFTTNGTGGISGGEFDYSDLTHYTKGGSTAGTIASTSTVAANADGTLTITLNTGDTTIGSPAGSGTITLNVSMVSSTATSGRGLLIENDGWATGSGELDFQDMTAPFPTPSGGYAFYSTGRDTHGEPMSLGGVINVDGAGTISGTGSIFDVNDSCATGAPASCAGATLVAQALNANASTVGAPDGFGFVQFMLNSAACAAPICPGSSANSIVLDGYMIDQNHIMLVENWVSDNLEGSPTGGMAISQTGPFTTAGAAGTYAFGVSGADTNGPLQAAGLLTLGGGNVTGNLSFNDIAAQSPQAGTAIAAGTYTVDTTTGRVTLAGVSDATPTFTYNLELYLTGEGHAFVISLDSTAATPDVLGGTSAVQASGTLNASSLSGSYALSLSQYVITSPPAEVEADSIGAFYADGSTNIFGFLSTNGTLAGAGLVSDKQFQNTFSSGSTNGVINVNGKANGVAVPYTAYLIDNTQGYVIENDASGLTLGYVIQH